MMFQNPEIAIDDLPNMVDLDWQSLDPHFVRRLQVEHGLTALASLAGATAFSVLVPVPPFVTIPLWVLVVSFAIATFAWPRISVPRQGYAVREKDIVFKKGVVWRSVTAIPYNRIQHVETSNTILDRKFGVASLKLFTAGGSGGDLKVRGISANNAERLRVFVLNKIGASIENH
jgi:membrane protein YdbS with pleckstrin-like domain